MAIGKLKTVVLDAPDIARLSAFYSGLAGWTQDYADHEWITMTTDDGWRIGLQSAPGHVPPQWPDASHPQQAHLDLRGPARRRGRELARVRRPGRQAVLPALERRLGSPYRSRTRILAG